MHLTPKIFTCQTMGKLVQDDHQEYGYPDFEDGGDPKKPPYTVTQISPVGDGDNYCQKDDK